jgi:hypothetical protein
MNLRQKAQGAPYHLVTSFDGCLLGRFWVVLLDCGVEVYQSHDDPLLDEPNAWMRLKQFCEDVGTKPINMAFSNKELDTNTQINLDPLADAYFYARRTRKMISPNPAFNGYQDNAQGVGQLHIDTLRIVWELDDGNFDFEERHLDHYPSPPISLIYKD